MKNMSLSRIAEACGGVYYGDKALADREAASITTDSRQAAEGCLFVAVKGRGRTAMILSLQCLDRVL